MSFDWIDYLRFAAVLAETTSDEAILSEAMHRSATSRAYYAAYNRAKNLALSEGFSPLSGPDHVNIPKYFRESKGKTGKKIAANLNRMRTNRNQADYEDRISRSSPRALASLTVEMAKIVFSLMDSLSHSD